MLLLVSPYAGIKIFKEKKCTPNLAQTLFSIIPRVWFRDYMIATVFCEHSTQLCGSKAEGAKCVAKSGRIVVATQMFLLTVTFNPFSDPHNFNL